MIDSIQELSFMVDGLDIAISTIRELREKCNFSVEDWKINEGQNIAFEKCLNQLMKERGLLLHSLKIIREEWASL